mmetsp:Transcript_36561/g.67351  ORF Transcript_36561/g.67351 Transcript_36561/m.67351 type:complete len:310 (-) Transcript_36561:3132-4061(-)
MHSFFGVMSLLRNSLLFFMLHPFGLRRRVCCLLLRRLLGSSFGCCFGRSHFFFVLPVFGLGRLPCRFLLCSLFFLSLMQCLFLCCDPGRLLLSLLLCFRLQRSLRCLLLSLPRGLFRGLGCLLRCFLCSSIRGSDLRCFCFGCLLLGFGFQSFFSQARLFLLPSSLLPRHVPTIHGLHLACGHMSSLFFLSYFPLLGFNLSTSCTSSIYSLQLCRSFSLLLFPNEPHHSFSLLLFLLGKLAPGIPTMSCLQLRRSFVLLPLSLLQLFSSCTRLVSAMPRLHFSCSLRLLFVHPFFLYKLSIFVTTKLGL